MAKTLDFNSVQRPTLTLTMKDAEHTQIRVGTPTEELIERLQTVMGELDEVLKAGDITSIRATFDLAAQLISCNRDGLKVTADDLRGRFDLGLEDLVIFYSAYIDFIGELEHAKN